MNRFMLTVTVATAALLGAYNATAQTVLYTPPGVAVDAAQPKPLGAFIAERITDKDASKFKQWLAGSDVKGAFDVNKGYTTFVVVDSAFDPAAKPVEHYIVNQRTGLSLMHGSQDVLKALNGDMVEISRTNNSYYVDGMRVNGVIKNPEGVIYLIGGSMSAQNI